MGVSELRKIRQHEKENRNLKQRLADLSLDKIMLQDVLGQYILSLEDARAKMGP